MAPLRVPCYHANLVRISRSSQLITILDCDLQHYPMLQSTQLTYHALANNTLFLSEHVSSMAILHFSSSRMLPFAATSASYVTVFLALISYVLTLLAFQKPSHRFKHTPTIDSPSPSPSSLMRIPAIYRRLPSKLVVTQHLPAQYQLHFHLALQFKELNNIRHERAACTSS